MKGFQKTLESQTVNRLCSKVWQGQRREPDGVFTLQVDSGDRQVCESLARSGLTQLRNGHRTRAHCRGISGLTQWRSHRAGDANGLACLCVI